MEKLYTAKATATGGRNGHITSTDGSLDVDVRTPESLGGPKGKFLNPEVMFAGGYAACFDNALLSIMGREKIRDVKTSVTAEVSLCKMENGGFNLAINLEVEINGLERQAAEELMQKAHSICPYSNATRGGVDVKVILK
ncbi:MAG: organic hydroperoxide resistance protein [Bacteroidia bacterium]